jgi:hypothetical protein
MCVLDYVRPASKVRIMAGDVPPWVKNNKRASYIRQACLSAPLWARQSDFKYLRELVMWHSEMTGVKHVIDHVIPLNHPRVSGLTVPWNLQVIPWRVNAVKGGTWCPEQEELF